MVLMEGRIMKQNCVVVDVDGTLAAFDVARVEQWVLEEDKNWDDFFEFMAEAEVIAPVQRLVQILKASGEKIVICSGRPRSHQAYTEAWLTKHNIPFDGVYLRYEEDDALPDEVVKEKLLAHMRQDGFEPWLVLDDRTSVVNFWREAGLQCLQCAPGDY